MARILFRQGLFPKDTTTLGLKRDYINKLSNVGNAVYLTGIQEILTCPENTFDVKDNLYSYGYYTPEEASEKFDCVVIGLANAFRYGFVGRAIPKLTKFAKACTIPVHIVGVGTDDTLDPVGGPFDFDDIVKEFVKTILEKSPKLGVRGEITKKYLLKLGFSSQDIEVIGCPSLYAFGDQFPVPTLPDKLEKVSLNYNGNHIGTPEVNFIENNWKLFPDSDIVCQRKDESLFCISDEKEPVLKYMPNLDLGKIKAEGHLKTFFSLREWMDYFKTRDISIGTRIHGSIVPLLAGCPVVMLPIDARTRELVEYSGIPTIPREKLRPNATILDYIDQIDFNGANKLQKYRFNNYLKFLDDLGLKHKYSRKPQLV